MPTNRVAAPAGLCYTDPHRIRSIGGRMTLRSEARTDAPARPAESEAPSRVDPWPTQVLDALDSGVVALDRERRVTWHNRRIEELLGMEPGLLLGMPGPKIFPGADARWLRGASREPREF